MKWFNNLKIDQKLVIVDTGVLLGVIPLTIFLILFKKIEMLTVL